MSVDLTKIGNLIKQAYNEGEWFGQSDKDNLKKLMGSLFDEIDCGKTLNNKVVKGKDGKISMNEDGITQEFATLFGLGVNQQMSKDEFVGKIDSVVQKLGQENKEFPTKYRNDNFKLQDLPKTMTQQEAYDAGKNAFTKMQWNTEYTDYIVINEQLAQLSPDNVVKFLEGFNDAKKGANFMHQNEGILEMMDDEYDGGRLEMKNKTHLVETLLSAAKAKGLENSTNYKTINIIMKQYRKDGALHGAKDFNQNHEISTKAWGSMAGVGAAAGVGGAYFASSPIGWASAGAALLGIGGAALADRRTDNERLDEAINGLLEEMKR